MGGAWWAAVYGSHRVGHDVPLLGQQRSQGCILDSPGESGLVLRGQKGLRSPGESPGVAAERSYPTSEARGSGREEQPHLQGAVAVRAQEGLEELFHIQGQKGRR